MDVRIVAATNTNIEQSVKEGRFREDLFYRLNVIRLRIPPLRERRDEIPALAHHFLGQAASEFRKGQMRLTEDMMEHLVLYPWPGNVRELQNEVRRMAALAEADAKLTPANLSETVKAGSRAAASRVRSNNDLDVCLTDELPATIARIERAMIEAALKRHQGRVDDAARSLGISRKGLYLKRQRLGL